MQKRTMLMLISSIVMLLLTSVTFVFAWFTIVEKTQEIIISSGNVKMEYSLVEIINENNEEKERPIKGPIPYYDLVPGDSFRYILKVTNKGNIKAVLSIDLLASGTSAELLQAFKIEYNEKDSYLKENEVENLVSKKLLDEDGEYILNFKIIFDENYKNDENFISNQKVTIESLRLTLTQA